MLTVENDNVLVFFNIVNTENALQIAVAIISPAINRFCHASIST